MLKVNEGAGTSPRLVAGYRVEGTLRRARQDDLVALLQAADESVLATQRSYEDFERPLVVAHAIRDVVSDELDDVVRDLHFDLASRFRDADKAKPCTDLFEEGLVYFTRVPLDDQETRVELLIGRTETVLPPEDPVRVDRVPLLRAKLDEFQASTADVEAAERDLDRARKTREDARSAWDTTFQTVWGTLVSRVGIDKAQQLYPKGKTKASSASPTVELPVPPADPPPAAPSAAGDGSGTGTDVT